MWEVLSLLYLVYFGNNFILFFKTYRILIDSVDSSHHVMARFIITSGSCLDERGKGNGSVYGDDTLSKSMVFDNQINHKSAKRFE